MQKRLTSIDFIKIIGLISMIQIHMGMYLLKYSSKILPSYQWMIQLGFIAAPLFLLAVGINLVTFMNKAGKTATKQLIKKSIFLIVVGLLFMLIWQADILHFIGIYILITLIFIGLSTTNRIIASLAFLFGSLVLLKYVNYMVGWEVLAYKLANFWTIKGFLANTFVNGFYPIFPWVVFTLVGTIIGTYLINSIKKKQPEKFAVRIFITSIILMVIGIALHNTIWTIKQFYPILPSYVIFFLGLGLFIFSIAFYHLDFKKQLPTFSRLISFLGSMALSLYILHIIVGLGYFYLTSSFNTLTLNQLLIYIPMILIITSLICYISKILIGDGPFEYLMRKLV